MLRNIFSFHIHSAQSSNTKFCCKLRSSDRESCYFDVWENESFKTEFHKFSWCRLDHEFIFSEMKCASSTFGFLLIAQKMVSPRGLEVYISRQSYQKCYQKNFYTCTFFLSPLHYQNPGFNVWLHFLQFRFWLPELKCNALQVFVLEDPDDDDDDSWTILRQFGSNYATLLDNLATTLRQFWNTFWQYFKTTSR